MILTTAALLLDNCTRRVKSHCPFDYYWTLVRKEQKRKKIVHLKVLSVSIKLSSVPHLCISQYNIMNVEVCFDFGER